MHSLCIGHSGTLNGVIGTFPLGGKQECVYCLPALVLWGGHSGSLFYVAHEHGVSWKQVHCPKEDILEAEEEAEEDSDMETDVFPMVSARKD